jgi:hypothetical protein
VGLVARVLEREGIATVTLSSALDITERVRPPRVAFLDFPLGNQVGPPGEPTLQRRILTAALRLLESVRRPGEVVRLPFAWSDPDWRARVVETYEREAAVVRRQRLAAEYVGGGNFAARECAEVCSLV